MSLYPPELTTLADYMTGEFDNHEQAANAPVWFVHLRLWQRRVPLFTQDSITLFAEQANIVKLNQPYRQRLMRLQAVENNPQFPLKVQYYRFKDPAIVQTAGQNPDLLQQIAEEQIELLSGCVLQVAHQKTEQGSHFTASLVPGAGCYFPYQGEMRQVSLGFEANAKKFLSYDKGIDPNTGEALWGAIMGAYEYTKRRSFE